MNDKRLVEALIQKTGEGKLRWSFRSYPTILYSAGYSKENGVVYLFNIYKNDDSVYIEIIISPKEYEPKYINISLDDYEALTDLIKVDIARKNKSDLESAIQELESL